MQTVIRHPFILLPVFHVFFIPLASSSASCQEPTCLQSPSVHFFTVLSSNQDSSSHKQLCYFSTVPWNQGCEWPQGQTEWPCSHGAIRPLGNCLERNIVEVNVSVGKPLLPGLTDCLRGWDVWKPHTVRWKIFWKKEVVQINVWRTVLSIAPT